MLDPLGGPGPIVANDEREADPGEGGARPVAGDDARPEGPARVRGHEVPAGSSYSAHATSRFAEYFAERKEKTQVHAGQKVHLHSPVTDDGVNWGGVVEGSETVTAADRTTKYVRGVDYTMDYGLGTFTALARP